MEEYIKEVLARFEEQDRPLAVDTMIKLNSRWGVKADDPPHPEPHVYIKSFFKMVRDQKKFD